MPPQIRPQNNKTFDAYYTDLAGYASQGATHEQAVRLGFTKLLDAYARPAGWTLLLEQRLSNGKIPDGTLYDSFRIPRGYWEAKDTHDDLEAEIQAKVQLGYPLTNTIFEDTQRAVLFQDRQRVLTADLRKPPELAGLLSRFFNYTGAQIEEFHRAVGEFQNRIPDLARRLEQIIEGERESNAAFVRAFESFHDLCRSALNPGIGAQAIEEMLVQHLLTERLFRTVFDNPEFTKRNAIASEIENVIAALTSQSFSRDAFLRQLDYFYDAIEATAKTIGDWSEKQGFLNTVYERFFQGFSRATADTHGIVYTPQAIVDFMCRSVEDVLQSEFGLSLSDRGVTILDPCTGTGNFMVNLLRRISPLDLRRKYEGELFANEVMLLPYYIASLNIEHAYFELMKQYKPFDGICFADTLDMAEGKQLAMFGEENTERVQRQKDAPITVIIGNPPYNVGQQNENDNNKNRKYPVVDKRIRDTYVKDSKATLRTQLYDAYVRFFRWASDRLEGRDGIVCFVSNNSFVDQIAFDGMRKHLAQDFTQIYHLDLHGNVRKNPKLSGTTHNVFGIQVGVGITIAVRKTGAARFIKYHRVPEDWRKTEKLAWLIEKDTIGNIEWQTLNPDAKNTWLTEGMAADFDTFLPLSKAAKTATRFDATVIFATQSNGINTARDSIVYDFDRQNLADRTAQFSNTFNDEVKRWVGAEKPKTVDDFVNYDVLKWSRNLKDELRREHYAKYDPAQIRRCMYRPFTSQWLYHSVVLVDELGTTGTFFPTHASENDNLGICLSNVGSSKAFHCLATNRLVDFHFTGDTKCYPLYIYSVGDSIRRENITDWALAQFREKYGEGVTKRDIFHYVYALLHHPEYRERYKENLKRELPRIPLVAALTPGPSPNAGRGEMSTEATSPGTGDAGIGNATGTPLPALGEGPGVRAATTFRALADAGAKLAALHVGYEQAPEYPLRQIVHKSVPFTWRVTKMKLSGDKTAVIVNDALTLEGVPPEAFDYRLGNRSALEWVIDQYRVTTDKRSGIVSDPNRSDDPEYIARLVGRVVTVSVESVRLVESLPPLDREDAGPPAGSSTADAG